MKLKCSSNRRQKTKTKNSNPQNKKSNLKHKIYYYNFRPIYQNVFFIQLRSKVQIFATKCDTILKLNRMQNGQKKKLELQSSNKRNPISNTKFIIPISYPSTKMYFSSNYIAKFGSLQQNVIQHWNSTGFLFSKNEKT